jgi:hypothetical protein
MQTTGNKADEDNAAADVDSTMQTTDDDAYNNATTQTMQEKADADDASRYTNTVMQTMDDGAEDTAVKQTTGNDAV